MLKYESRWGSNINTVAEEMIELAKEKDESVYCEFNGVMVTASKDMTAKDVTSIFSFVMNLICTRYQESDECIAKEKKREEERKTRSRQQSIPIKPFKLKITKEEYQTWKDNQSEGYGQFTFKCAEKWAELMEEAMAHTQELTPEIIRKASHNCYTDESTGAMMGMALSILKECWLYGDQLPDSLFDI